jgi:hypothetical protein
MKRMLALCLAICGAANDPALGVDRSKVRRDVEGRRSGSRLGWPRRRSSPDCSPHAERD